jgi:hypothetical protein
MSKQGRKAGSWLGLCPYLPDTIAHFTGKKTVLVKTIPPWFSNTATSVT